MDAFYRSGSLFAANTVDSGWYLYSVAVDTQTGNENGTLAEIPEQRDLWNVKCCQTFTDRS